MVLTLVFPLPSSLLSNSLIPSEGKIGTCWGKLRTSAAQPVLPGCLLPGMASLFLGLYLVLFSSLDPFISRKEEGWLAGGVLLHRAGEKNSLYDAELDFPLFTENKKCTHNSH